MMLLDDTPKDVSWRFTSFFFLSVCKTLNLRRLRVIDVPTWHMAFTVSLKHYIVMSVQFYCILSNIGQNIELMS